MKARIIHAAFCFLLGFALSACVSSEPPAAFTLGQIQWPPLDYKHTVSTGAIRQYWNCLQPEPDLVRLDGIVANQWNGQPVKFLEWELVGVNGAGRAVSGAKVESKAILLMTNQYTQYQIDLRTSGTEVRFDLYYQYKFDTRSHRSIDASLDWDGPVHFAQQTIDARPAWDGPVLFAQQNQRFFVLDACSDSQHLAP